MTDDFNWLDDQTSARKAGHRMSKTEEIDIVTRLYGHASMYPFSDHGRLAAEAAATIEGLRRPSLSGREEATTTSFKSDGE